MAAEEIPSNAQRSIPGNQDPGVAAAFSAIYAELKAMAHAQRVRWDGDFTLNTTALVHEAYLKLSRAGSLQVESRAHFLALAGRAMRQILVNYAEQRHAQKRGGGQVIVPLDDSNPVAEAVADQVLALHEALERLETLEVRHARVVEYRFFAGLQVDETAEALGVSPATVKRDWQLASAWLRRELGALPGGPATMG